METTFVEILTSLLPFFFVILIWIYIIYRAKRFNKTNDFAGKHEETLEVLREIRDELKELNKNNSERNYKL